MKTVMVLAALEKLTAKVDKLQETIDRFIAKDTVPENFNRG
jgi:hypothetical protein